MTDSKTNKTVIRCPKCDSTRCVPIENSHNTYLCSACGRTFDRRVVTTPTKEV